MKTVAQVSKLTGVSVRTLHHYDKIGLLKPAQVTEAGYRLYDDASLRRLHTVLLLRELKFSLKEIGEILDAPGFDPMEALSQQIELLQLQMQHLEQIIAHARKIQKTGVIPMDFSSFDTGNIDRYAAQAKEKWGSTAAYREYEEKTKQYGHQERIDLAEGMDQMMAAFAQCMKQGNAPDSAQAQTLVKSLQNHISETCYRCTEEILAGLGQMYVADERFRSNIDKHAEGTAAYISEAIGIYCGR